MNDFAYLKGFLSQVKYKVLSLYTIDLQYNF